MNPVARAYEVWQEAQAKLVRASAKLLGSTGAKEAAKAERRYQDALDECAMAKSFYDMMREAAAESGIKSRPTVC